MDIAFSKPALIGQTLRAAYHDSGTFNQVAGDGGANGCLMNSSGDMIDDAAGENKGLEGPMKVLRVSYLYFGDTTYLTDTKLTHTQYSLILSIEIRESRIDYSVQRYQVLT